MEIPRLFAILNLTSDSFSDGGKYLDPDLAIDQAKRLAREGANGIDIGAQSSNPEAKILGWKEEWDRISRIWNEISRITDGSGRNVEISIDSYNPEVLERAWEKGIDYWNDITALGRPGIENIIRNHRFTPMEKYPKFIAMFSHNRGRIAEKKSLLTKESIVEEILAFFLKERETWISWGIPEDHIIYDPGMGFFLGDDPELSLEVVRNIPRLREKLGKVLVSVSRKSFLGSSLGGRPPLERRYATFATELLLASRGVDYIRTHEISPLLDMIRIYQVINENPYTIS